MEFNIQIPDIEINIDFNDNQKNKFCKPINHRCEKVKYKNASELSKNIVITKNERYFILVSGNFIFGDFIEAFLVDRNMQANEVTISTLSLSQ